MFVSPVSIICEPRMMNTYVLRVIYIDQVIIDGYQASPDAFQAYYSTISVHPSVLDVEDAPNFFFNENNPGF